MNDWGFKRFLAAILSIQLVLWVVIGLDLMGLQIPILRQLIGFVYLAFIPGILILRALKLHNLSNIETLLYTVGLSIVTLMSVGLLMNVVCPLFGLFEPISMLPLTITISIVILMLCVLCYVRDKDFSNPSFIDVENTVAPPALFLCLIPFLTIFGTYLTNFYNNNIFLMFLIVVLALMVLLVAFDKFIPKNLYPLAIFIIAISLLFHRSLISMYLTGWDIQHEFYLSNLVITSSIWTPTIPFSTNAMLSIVILAPLFSNMCSMSPIWVFKIIYPLLFSLVPLGLYHVFRMQTNDKIAFLSCFFFMSVFYIEMPTLARQQIAELFLVSLMLLMVNKNINRVKRTVLIIIFAFSLVVSHYGLAYIFMLSLIIVSILFFLNVWHRNQSNMMKSTITPTFILLYITFAITWYMYVSSSSAFTTIVHIGDHIANSIFTDFLNTEAAQGIAIITAREISPLHAMVKYFHLIFQFFIAVGIFTLRSKREEFKFEKEYVAISYILFVICICGIVVPFFASSLNTTRLYQMTLIFLAPFCVFGGTTVFEAMNKRVKISRTDNSMASSLKILSVFFAIFLLFSTGFVFEIAKDYPESISLNNTIDYPHFNDWEVFGAKWWYSVKGRDRMYADEHRRLVLCSFEWNQVGSFPPDADRMLRNSYIYLGTLNIVEGKVTCVYKEGVCNKKIHLNSSDVVGSRSRIYDNAGAQIYYR